MAHPATTQTAHVERSRPFAIDTIGPADLKEALALGLDDFRSKPSHLVFLSIIYPVVGLILCRLAFGYAVLPLIYPLIAGFALVGPFAAVGLYEISRRREQGHKVAWQYALGAFRSAGTGAIFTLGAVLVAIFLAWLATANRIYEMTFGAQPHPTLSAFVTDLFTTQAGLNLIVLGNGAGLMFAVVVLAISVVSFPLILDRHVDALTAVRTSLRAVAANPVTMGLWGLIVLLALAAGSLPFLVGLAVVMPILGHATWHLYRKVVKT